MKKIVLILSLVLPWVVQAQNSTDALRYSKTQYLGTARFTAMGGSMGALGGDVSSLIVNPGALGVYRNSEFTFTTAFALNDLSANFRGNTIEENKLNFNIGNIAYVGAYKGDPNGWKNYSFSVGYNRLANFNGQSRILGNNPNSSIIDDYVSILNSNNASTRELNDYAYPFGPSQAYWIYLIDSVAPNTHDRYLNFHDNIEQSRRVETRGRQGETYFSFGGNYLDRFYLGGSMGIQNVRFEQETRFTENYTYNPPALPSEFLAKEYQENTDLITTGTGVNFKLGFIYRISNEFRLGGAIHSPTFFGMSEQYTFESSSRFSNGESFEGDQVESNYDYRLQTPMRLNASLAYVLAGKGAINVDYEYLDYSTARLNDVSEFEYDFSASNEGIRNNLAGAHNIRVGAEYFLNPFVLRAGLRLEDNPYADNLSLRPNEKRNTYSLGTGFRAKNYNIDLTYMLSQMEITDPVYFTSDAAAKINQQVHNLIITVGWKW